MSDKSINPENDPNLIPPELKFDKLNLVNPRKYTQPTHLVDVLLAKDIDKDLLDALDITLFDIESNNTGNNSVLLMHIKNNNVGKIFPKTSSLFGLISVFESDILSQSDQLVYSIVDLSNSQLDPINILNTTFDSYYYEKLGEFINNPKLIKQFVYHPNKFAITAIIITIRMVLHNLPINIANAVARKVVPVQNIREGLVNIGNMLKG